ncbi:lipid II flippase MurJ [uncultured Zobellia sp.]|uniref:murein biosynthesis integral membrane protein MurJ n=1 Tax=uncultured Zobellia sp. TaxID=255433 RepID=UPI002596AA06|nr:lipid II flippase MurJ [uncultured Zobellia sp.]
MKKITELVKKLLNNPLIINILSVGIITLIVKGLGFYKETLVASTIGLSELLDTFYIAILIPSFVQNVFVGSLKNLFIPNYLAEIKSTNKAGEFQSVSFIIITGMVVILSLLSILFVYFGLEFVFKGHNPLYYELIRMQFYIILPCLLIWGYSSLIGGLLEIDNKFIISSLTPIFASITTIICLVFFKEELRERVLAIGILSGSILGFLFLTGYSYSSKNLTLKHPVINSNIRVMIKQLPPKITSGFLTGINPFVDQFFAAQLVVGSVSAINYGIKIPQFIVGILILAIGNVLLPHFSKLTVENIEKAYQQLFKVLKLIFGSTLVVVVIGIYFSDEIVSFLFERNEFEAEDTLLVADLQRIVLIYVPFYLTTLVLVKFLTSINKNSFMAWVSLWNLILNIILNSILIKTIGIYGLVLSTTMVYIVSSLFYLGFTLKEFKKLKLNTN